MHAKDPRVAIVDYVFRDSLIGRAELRHAQHPQVAFRSM
jgi:hypothetical protein